MLSYFIRTLSGDTGIPTNIRSTPIMFDMLDKLWALLSGVITGTQGYVDAYANLGDTLAQKTNDFKEEETLLSQIRRAELSEKYKDILKAE
jgi:hypothetical protein